ncbi:hypothetical protein ACL02U_13530 [Streptomyces sp. MS06]|uniref:Rv1733c family protein n=1 Tax=Streptomyces sp. MS06 TaxID=3385974 RepID=UPI0039A053AC
MRVISGLWRWRRNPLCRATDLAEAWLALVALLLVAVAAPVTGVLTGRSAQDSLQRTVRAQHRTRHLVTATVVRETGSSAPEADPGSAALRVLRSRVVADWTAPDGLRHEGPLIAPLEKPRRGDRFAIWTDSHGNTVARPLDAATATMHAVLAGLGVALLAAGGVVLGRRLVLGLLVRRRYAHWDRAWGRAGPDWGRTGTGS